MGDAALHIHYTHVDCALGVFKKELEIFRAISRAYCKCRIVCNKSERFYSVSMDSLWSVFHDSDRSHNGYSGRL